MHCEKRTVTFAWVVEELCVISVVCVKFKRVVCGYMSLRGLEKDFVRTCDCAWAVEAFEQRGVCSDW